MKGRCGRGSAGVRVGGQEEQTLSTQRTTSSVLPDHAPPPPPHLAGPGLPAPRADPGVWRHLPAQAHTPARLQPHHPAAPPGWHGCEGCAEPGHAGEGQPSLPFPSSPPAIAACQPHAPRGPHTAQLTALPNCLPPPPSRPPPPSPAPAPAPPLPPVAEQRLRASPFGMAALLRRARARHKQTASQPPPHATHSAHQLSIHAFLCDEVARAEQQQCQPGACVRQQAVGSSCLSTNRSSPGTEI